jgi:hypothetical protein
MISETEAAALLQEHLADTPKYGHSRAVGEMLRQLARICHADPKLWVMTGLLHDLDIYHTKGDRTRHGLLAAAWIGERLPAAALDAICAHDHRTGVRPNSTLALALKLADILVVTVERAAFQGTPLRSDAPPRSGPAPLPDLDAVVEDLLRQLGLELGTATALAVDAVHSAHPTTADRDNPPEDK